VASACVGDRGGMLAAWLSSEGRGAGQPPLAVLLRPDLLVYAVYQAGGVVEGRRLASGLALARQLSGGPALEAEAGAEVAAVQLVQTRRGLPWLGNSWALRFIALHLVLLLLARLLLKAPPHSWLQVFWQ
jgi:hypothetical protein